MAFWCLVPKMTLKPEQQQTAPVEMRNQYTDSFFFHRFVLLIFVEYIYIWKIQRNEKTQMLDFSQMGIFSYFIFGDMYYFNPLHKKRADVHYFLMTIVMTTRRKGCGKQDPSATFWHSFYFSFSFCIFVHFVQNESHFAGATGVQWNHRKLMQVDKVIELSKH